MLCERFKCAISTMTGVCTPLLLRMRVQDSIVEFSKYPLSSLGAGVVCQHVGQTLGNKKMNMYFSSSSSSWS